MIIKNNIKKIIDLLNLFSKWMSGFWMENVLDSYNNFLNFFYNFLFYHLNSVSSSLHTLFQFFIRNLSSKFYNRLFFIQINLRIHLAQSIQRILHTA